MLRATTTLSALSISFLLVAACSSSSSGSGVSNDSACDNYAGAILDADVRCGIRTAISSDERSAYISRFRVVCNEAITATGSGITSGFLSGCTSALSKNPSCSSTPPECATPAGSLAIGAACGGDEQCQSTHCAVSGNGGSADAGISNSCGTCKATIADGAACAPDDTCVAGDQCSNGICVKETSSTGGSGPIGSACQGDTDCASPNHCDFTAGICAAPGNAGAACFIAGDCASGLICTTSNQCEKPVATGGPCHGGDCATGLGCDQTAHKCASISFAAQGAACDGDAVLCDRGTCILSANGTTTGTCPTITQDGAACGAGQTCDDFAECIGGQCQVPNPAQCK